MRKRIGSILATALAFVAVMAVSRTSGATIPGECPCCNCLNAYMREAQQGDAKAQYEVSRCYAEGEPTGCLFDPGKTSYWVRKAAEGGSPEAQHQYAWNFIYGVGVPRSTFDALQWWRKAARQGYAPAQFDLAQALEQGVGASPDPKEAMAWYKQAAQLGEPRARARLGMPVATNLCQPEEARLCAGVQPGSGRITQCLVKNVKALSIPCRNDLGARLELLQELQTGCRSDLDRLCKSRPAATTARACLEEKRAQVGSLCLRALERLGS